METYEWIPELDGVLLNGGRYRFAVIVPGAWTSDVTQTELEGLGWAVVSIGAPPPDAAAAIAALAAEDVPSPAAFWVIATWGGTNGATLPASVPGSSLTSGGQMFFTLLDIYSPVSGEGGGTPPLDLTPVYALLGGALLFGSVLYSMRGATTGRLGYSLANPVETIRWNALKGAWKGYVGDVYTYQIVRYAVDGRIMLYREGPSASVYLSTHRTIQAAKRAAEADLKAHGRMRNPVDQILQVPIAGKRMAVRVVEKSDGTWCAGVRLKLKRRSVDVVEVGATKEEAVHRVMTRASQLAA